MLPGGKLEFYGKVDGPTWTSLAQNAAAGATTITLMDAVQWKVGDQYGAFRSSQGSCEGSNRLDRIAIAGTNYINGWYNTEANWGNEVGAYLLLLALMRSLSSLLRRNRRSALFPR